MGKSRAIHWGSAEVEDATLTVELSRSSSKQWKARFERTVSMLGGARHDWDEVRLARRRIHVTNVSPGSEEEVRHFLESVVMEANAGSDRNTDSDDRAPVGAAEPSPDAQMQSRFRAFADSDRARVESGS